MQAHASEPHRQLLMQCEVVNQNGKATERYVPHEVFDLWRHLLVEKHGLTVIPGAPCVWVPDDECRRHDNLFAHARQQTTVVRLSYERFDPHTGITAKRTRFVPGADEEAVRLLLERHFAGNAEETTVHAVSGQAITTLSPRPPRGYLRARRAGASRAA